MTTKGRTSTKKFKFKGFENLEFNDLERQEVIAQVEHNKFDPVDCLVVLVEAGYKVGIGYDDYHACNAISITCKDEGSPYLGYCFVFRHTDLGRGLQVMRYVLDTQLADELYNLEKAGRLHSW